MRIPTFLPGLLAVAFAGAAVAAPAATPVDAASRVRLESPKLHMEVSPRLGGRVLHFSLPGAPNLLLTGEAPTAQDRERIEAAVKGVDNVRGVVNELAVMPNSSLTQRSNDTLITGKVKASFVDAKDISLNAFKVVTERNTVYLLGIVTTREANRVTDITRGVGGVEKVVRVFEIVSEEELARTQPKPAPVVNDPAAK